MKLNDSILTGHINKCVLNDAPGSFPRTLFVHIPKTGGTTLDSILGDHYFAYSLVRNLQFTSDISLFSEIDKEKNRYISGHFPVSIAGQNKFEDKITILRNPLDVLCSLFSFAEKIGYKNPRLFSALEGGGKYEIYREYFSPNFDLDRFLIDKNYGLSPGFYPYAEQCSVNEAANTLTDFNFVLDFDHLDDGIKSLIMSKKLFPYSSIARNHSYGYQPDYERAKLVLSEFDEKFYAQLHSLFFKRLGNIDTRFDRYKKLYCKTQGILLEVNQNKNIDLRGPVGVGWNKFEISENGSPFRWSETPKPTIELPIVNAGLYVVYFYWCRGQANNVTVSIVTLIGQEHYIPTLVEEGEINIFRCCISLHSADWIYANFEIELNIDAEGKAESEPTSDLRSLGIILGNVYIKRVTSV